jgi:uncharacterized membrane protein
MLKHTTYISILADETSAFAVAPKFSTPSIVPSRKRLARTLVIMIALVLSCTGFITAFASSGSPEHEESYETVIVQAGETLWNIALAHKPSAMDTRQYVDLLMELNNIEHSKIIAGEVLNLPNLE